MDRTILYIIGILWRKFCLGQQHRAGAAYRSSDPAGDQSHPCRIGYRTAARRQPHRRADALQLEPVQSGREGDRNEERHSRSGGRRLPSAARDGAALRAFQLPLAAQRHLAAQDAPVADGAAPRDDGRHRIRLLAAGGDEPPRQFLGHHPLGGFRGFRRRLSAGDDGARAFRHRPKTHHHRRLAADAGPDAGTDPPRARLFAGARSVAPLHLRAGTHPPATSCRYPQSATCAFSTPASAPRSS